MACQGPGARDVLVRPGASVRGGTTSRHRDRCRRGHARARPCSGCRQLRRHGADERTDPHDPDFRRPRGELDAPRLDRRRAGRFRRRGLRRRHGRTERHGGVQRALRAPRHPHRVERPGLPRSARLSPGRDGAREACARAHAVRAARAGGRSCGACVGSVGARPRSGRGAGCVGGGAGARRPRGGSRTVRRSACDGRRLGAGATGGALGRPRHGFAAAARGLRAHGHSRAARARAGPALRSACDSAPSRTGSCAERAGAGGRVGPAASAEGDRPASGKSSARRAGAACGPAELGSCGSPRVRRARRRPGSARRAARVGGRGDSEPRGRSYDHEPVSKQ